MSAAASVAPGATPRHVSRRATFRLRGKSARSVDAETPPTECGEFLHIGPAFGGAAAARRGLGPRAHSTLGNNYRSHVVNKSDLVNGNTVVPPCFQAVAEGHNHQLNMKHQKDKEKAIDRISLDRRGLTCIPTVMGESKLRLLSLQHNLLNSLSGLNSIAEFSNLVFLDVYDNQIDKISCLEGLSSLRVLLMGKNRIRRIEGLSGVKKLEVLDLHGNRVTQTVGLKGLNELKVLNLAGNQIRNVELAGLPELRELNLKRNRIRKLVGCEGVPKIQKLFLSNNDLQSIDDIASVALALSLREITLDNNPVSLGGDCISFLVSYLPNLCFLSQMQVTDQVRRAAMAWRHNKETNNTVYSELGEEVDANARREQVISNARTNWELLRSQNKCLANHISNAVCNNLGLSPEYVLEANGVKSDSPELFKQLSKANKNTKLANVLNNNADKRLSTANRSTSQDTDISHSTSTTSSDQVKLPPILVPIMDSLEHQKLNLIKERTDSGNGGIKCFKRWESISSVDPVLNSSMSSLLTTTTSDSESESSKKVTTKRLLLTANKKRATFAASKSVSVSEIAHPSKTWLVKNRSISDNSENASSIMSTNFNSAITNSSTSGSDIANKNTGARRETMSSRAGSAKNRHIKSATTVRKNLLKQVQNRAVTAKPKQIKTVNIVESSPNSAMQPTSEPAVKDREQGSDWLVEVKNGQASVWGAGALRRLEKAWPSANDVTTIHFHYVSFSNICSVLPSIKNRFPNAIHLTFRACGIACVGQLGALAALRGISSLTIHKEGNPLSGHSWHSYALYRLAHWGLCSLDHVQVTDEEITSANEEYAGLSDVVLWSLPDSLLQPLLARLQGEKDNNNASKQADNARNTMPKDGYQKKVFEKEYCFGPGGRELAMNHDIDDDCANFGPAQSWLWNSDSTLKDVVAKEALQWRRSAMSQEEVLLRHRGRSHLTKVLFTAAEAALKLKLLRRHWPALLLQLINTILCDFSHLQRHVDETMRELQSELCMEGLKKNNNN